MQYERDWTVENVKNWLGSLDTVDSTEFFVGTETVGANDSGWDDVNKPEHTSPTVIYDEITNDQSATKKLSLFGGNCSISGNLQIV